MLFIVISKINAKSYALLSKLLYAKMKLLAI